MGVTQPKPDNRDSKTIRLSRNLQSVARDLDRRLERDAGGPMLFSLIVWSNGRGQRTQYVSNVTRPDAVKALEELLERWRNPDMPDVPAHEVQ